jgi:hypothetical protein
MRGSANPLRKAMRRSVTVDRLGAVVERRPSAETIAQQRWEGSVEKVRSECAVPNRSGRWTSATTLTG